jgi:hypothetical protein
MTLPRTSGLRRTPSTDGSSTAGCPAHKIGRLWKFKLSEIDEWVRACDAHEDEER